MMSSSRHFSFLSCLQNSRKAKKTVEFLETMKNRGLRWVVSGAPPFRGTTATDLVAIIGNRFRRVFFYDLTREPLQYLIRSHFRFQL